MSLYLPSAQAKKGDECLDDARTIRDQWRDLIPRNDFNGLQNRLAMLTCYVLMAFTWYS